MLHVYPILPIREEKSNQLNYKWNIIIISFNKLKVYVIINVYSFVMED